jgi:hypothetical protein
VATKPRCPDEDGDGWPSRPWSCEHEQTGLLDCNDQEATIHPEAAELCNQVDDDCDTVIDEEQTDAACALSCSAPEGGCEVPTEIAVEDSTACIRTEGGRVYCWGERTADLELRRAPYLVAVPGLEDATALIGTSCAVTPTRLVCWGTTPLPYEVPLEPDATSYAWGIGLCTLSTAGALSCGRETFPSVEPSRMVLEPANVRAVSGVAGHGLCAIIDRPGEPSGTARCWSDLMDDRGNLALHGTVTDGITALAVHTDGVCGVTEGTVRCSDDITDYPGYGTATAITVGSIHRCAIDATGAVACWRGVKPASLPPAREIAAGDLFTCILTTGAEVLCWGIGIEGGRGFPDLPVAGPPPRPATTAPRREGRMFQSPPLGACDSPTDFSNAALYLERVKTCRAECANALDVAACVDTCVGVPIVSDACSQCMIDYVQCTAPSCYPALVACAGFPPDLAALRKNTAPPVDPCRASCQGKKHLGENCAEDDECLSDFCGSPPTPPLAGGSERICRF